MWSTRLARPAKRRKLSPPSARPAPLGHLDGPASSPLARKHLASATAARAHYSQLDAAADASQRSTPFLGGPSGGQSTMRSLLRQFTSTRALGCSWSRNLLDVRIPTRSSLTQCGFATSSRTASPAAQATSLPGDTFVPTNDPPPLNQAEVPLIAPNLRAQLFPPPTSPYSPPPPSPRAVKLSLEHLRANGLLAEPAADKAKSKTPAPATDFQLPHLQGPTISHHFHSLGQNVAEPYLSLARSFAELNPPPMPEKERWVCMSGWTRYSADGSFEAVDFPSEESQAMVFDVETLPFQGGAFPIMAVAVGKDGWYGWCSPWLTGDDPSPNHLIPFSRPPPPSPTSPHDDFASRRSTLFERPEDVPRLFIGHNVLFDRARVASEYALRRPSTRFVDTLSLHVAVSGLTNPQRPGWLKYRKDLESAEVQAVREAARAAKAAKAGVQPEPKKVAATTAKTWREVGSVNSLSEVARLHCGTKVDKSLRNVLIDPSTTIHDIRDDFENMMGYCAVDVLTTLDVYRVLLPKFLATCPHPASFAGVLLMSQPVLPVDRRWPRYLERAEEMYQQRLLAVKDALKIIAEEARIKGEERGAGGRYEWEDDLWLRQLDWSPKKARRLPGDVPPKRRAAQVTASIKAAKAKRKREEDEALPMWFSPLLDAKAKISIQSPIAALLFQTTWRSWPVVFTESHGYLFAVPNRRSFKPLPKEVLVDPEELGKKDSLVKTLTGVKLYTVPHTGAGRCRTILGRGSVKRIKDGQIGSVFKEMEAGAAIGKDGEAGTKYLPVAAKLRELAIEALKLPLAERKKSLWLRQLDWTPDIPPAPVEDHEDLEVVLPTPSRVDGVKQSDLYWPQWFWALDVPGGGLEVTVGKRAVPLLLKLRWRGFPIVYSKAHGWIYRVPLAQLGPFLESDPSLRALKFDDVADADLDEDSTVAAYFKMPHPDGEGKNVGSPLSKPFVASFEDGILTSEYPVAREALALNASCSYWTSSRERIMNQMVVWEGDAKMPAPTPAAIAAEEVAESTQGLILPQVIPMGTVTRRAVEKTWLTASNAKKNRVGSELKSMIVAPPGYAIVGADVDSEELWICSVMGDAQFGIHGASAIGWMTLEGTKAAGTDLHSKSASILGISRDDAKVFNYSRIYGAGVKHAVQLLLKSNPTLSTDQATKLAKNLYASTKGLVDRSPAFGRQFWHGGTESLVFNKLEQIAKSDQPRTPALGCGLTAALTKCFLPAEGRSAAGEGFMPSRINWVVQSSGVDYLHLLLVAMEYLTKRFEIDARYMISVHDEVRYLVKEEDKYRAAMAMQVANIWTRSLFAFRLQMPDLPQGCAFFSAVDVDTCFRKEVNMTCLTPSNPDSIPFGESLDISQSLASTSGGSLFPDGRSMALERELQNLPKLPRELTDEEVVGEMHRVEGTAFLQAQTSGSSEEIRKIWRREQEGGGGAGGSEGGGGQGRVLPPKRLGAASRQAGEGVGAEAELAQERQHYSRASHRDEQQAMSDYFLSPQGSPQGYKPRPRVVKKRQQATAAPKKEEEEDFDPELAPEVEDEYSTHEPLRRSAV